MWKDLRRNIVDSRSIKQASCLAAIYAFAEGLSRAGWQDGHLAPSAKKIMEIVLTRAQ